MVTQPQKSAHSGNTVTVIGNFLAPELARVDRLLRQVLESESALIREVGDYICLTSGKKLRPMLTLLAGRAFGGPDAPPPVEIAAAMEAVHVATLLHDDVIDEAPLRRGRPSVNARWGSDVAILMADYLYASAFELAMQHLDPEPLRLICEVTRRMCEGEMYQIERREKLLSPDEYLYIITCKTAYLFSACAALGANHVGQPAEVVAAATAFGLDFGLAFQITDDTLDYTALDADLGKQAGADLAAGKQTLPLILALETVPPERRARIVRLVEQGDIEAIRAILEETGSIARALEIAGHYAQQCRGHLGGLPARDDIAFDYLQSLAEYVTGRRS